MATRAAASAQALGVLLLCALAACGGRGTPRARNLLMISVDTLRADALSCAGGPEGITPRLDRWAERSVRFARAWSHSPKTAPAHMTMLTGLPPRVHGVGNLDSAGAAALGPEARTLAEILSARGFATGGFAGGGNVKGKIGFDRGFEVFRDGGGSFAEKIADLTAWLDARTEERRWFAFLHTYRVHDPYLPSPETAARFADPSYSGRIPIGRQALLAAMREEDLCPPAGKGHDRLVANFWFRADERDPEDLALLRGLYLAGVAEMDAELGELLDALEAKGQLDDAVLVLTSDHGEEFGEHGLTRHDQLWRELLHVPLVVHLPGDAGAETVIEADVRHVDLVPSLLELLDVPDPVHDRIGESWAPWLLDPARAEPRPLFAEHRSKNQGPLDLWVYRDGDLALHVERGGEGLFDLSADWSESAPLHDPVARERLLGLQRKELARQQVLSERYATGEGIELDAALREELERLGYLAGSSDE